MVHINRNDGEGFFMDDGAKSVGARLAREEARNNTNDLQTNGQNPQPILNSIVL
jgi:hypothetical protein